MGSRLLLDLVRADKKVRALKRESSNLSLIKAVFEAEKHSSYFDRIEWFSGDVLDSFSLEEAMMDVNQVYHCAGMVSFLPKEEKRMMKINAEGTAHVVNAAVEKGIRKLCFVSSIAALGRGDNNELIAEDKPWKNSYENSAYAVSKYSAEREVWRGIAEGLNAVIVNPSVILGPGNGENSSSAIFGKVWKGLKFYTEGVDGFVDVRDVAKAMTMLMDSDISNERFIVSSENCSYKNLVFEIARCFGKPLPGIKANRWMGELVWRAEALRSILTGSKPFLTKQIVETSMGKYFYSNEKIKARLGMEFIPVQKSIEDTCSFFLKNQFTS